MEVDLACMLFSHVASPSPTHLEISHLIDDNRDLLSPFGAGSTPDNVRWKYDYDVIHGDDVAMMTSSPYATVYDDYVESPELDELEVTGTVCQPLSPSGDSATGAGAHRLQMSSSTSASQTPLLPPCRVCGEKASGFHYGANTCEACKGFFRRSLQRKEEYKCAGTGSCEILPGKRNICASCRYKKCLRVGMSKQAIKTGRYTHEKKTRDIQEVKRLQQLEQMTHQQRHHALSHHRFDDLLTSQLCDSSVTVVNESGYGTDDSGELLKTSQNGAMIRTSPTSSSLRQGCYDNVDYSLDDETGRAMDKLLQSITDLHEQQTPHTREFFEKLPAKEKEYFEQRALHQEVFGPMKTISHNEYKRIYQTTGIDVDGRREMLKHMIPCIEKAIKRFITFAKMLPGFKQLTLDDQIALIKGSRFEAWLVSAHKAFNPSMSVFTHACGYTVHIEEMARLYDLGFLQNAFRVIHSLQQLCLSTEEECILKGIIVLSRDRCELQQPDVVEVNQITMFRMMERVRRRRRPHDQFFIARVIAVLVELRTLTDMHEKQESKIGLEWCTDIKIPPLLYEIFSV